MSLLETADRIPAETVIAVTGKGALTDELHRRKMSVVMMPYPELLSNYGGEIYLYRGFRKFRMIKQTLAYIYRIRRQIKALGVDCVYCNDMRGLLTAGVAARSLCLPVLIWDKLNKPHGWFDWLQLPLVTRNLIISDSVKIKYPRWQQKLFGRKILKVFNGADLSRADHGKSIRHLLPCEESDIVLGIIGAITERKGQDIIIRDWDKLSLRCPNLRLWVIGEKPGGEKDQRYFNGLSNKQHQRIHFLGMRDDVPDLMRSIDILIVPSRYEGAGQVIFEAMAAEVPVIGAKAGGIPEMVADGETGLLFDSENREQFMEQICRLAVSRPLRKDMGRAGRKRVEAFFSRDVQMKKVIQILLDMINKKKKRTHEE